MSSIKAATRSDAETVLIALESAAESLVESDFDSLSNTERLDVLRRVETIARRLPAVGHTLVSQIERQATSTDFGGESLRSAMAAALRITPTEASRRIAEARDLGNRYGIDSQPFEPTLPATAKQQRVGVIGPEHVKVIRAFLHRLPSEVDAGTRTDAEHRLADLATTLRPDELRVAAHRLDAYLNPDGTLAGNDRARMRYFQMHTQDSDKLTRGRFAADPELAAYMEHDLREMGRTRCNPDDAVPTVDGEPADPHSDHRSIGQRQHDALKAVARAMLASGQLGQHRGLPVTVTVSTALRGLEDATSGAVTGGGTQLPIGDLLRMARHAHHYLTLFDDTGRPLYLGRAKRIASAEQRIVLHAGDRGCAHPGCDAAGYRCQTHHVDEWAHGGHTDIDRLTFVCDRHHALVTNTDTGWRTVKHRTGRTRWIPPATIDPTRQARTNTYHHPSDLLLDHAESQPRAG